MTATHVVISVAPAAITIRAATIIATRFTLTTARARTQATLAEL